MRSYCDFIRHYWPIIVGLIFLKFAGSWILEIKYVDTFSFAIGGGCLILIALEMILEAGIFRDFCFFHSERKFLLSFISYGRSFFLRVAIVFITSTSLMFLCKWIFFPFVLSVLPLGGLWAVNLSRAMELSLTVLVGIVIYKIDIQVLAVLIYTNRPVLNAFRISRSLSVLKPFRLLAIYIGWVLFQELFAWAYFSQEFSFNVKTLLLIMESIICVLSKSYIIIETFRYFEKDLDKMRQP